MRFRAGARVSRGALRRRVSEPRRGALTGNRGRADRATAAMDADDAVSSAAGAGAAAPPRSRAPERDAAAAAAEEEEAAFG